MWLMSDLYRFHGPFGGDPVSRESAESGGWIVLGETIETLPLDRKVLYADCWALVPRVSYQRVIQAHIRYGAMYSLPHLCDPRILQFEEFKQLSWAVDNALCQARGSDPATVGLLADWLQDHDEPEAARFYADLYSWFEAGQTPPDLR